MVVRPSPADTPVRVARGCFWIRIGCLAAAATISTAPAVGGDLLDLPFEELLQVEIRSAGKREEEIRDIPASVTIVTREEIERYGWLTFEEVLRNAPGFFILDNIEERFIGTRGAVGGGVQFLVNGVAQHPSQQKTLTVPEIARLSIPVEAIDRIEIIRGPMSVIYGNNAFLGVVNVVTNDVAANGSRVSASLGTRGTGALFARLGDSGRDGFVVLNAGARRDDGLAGAYAHMMSPDQLAALDPAMHDDMDGDMGQEEASLELSGAWRSVSADLRWTRRDYGIYALTPAFDDGTRIRLDTLHASLGWDHRFSDRLGLRVTGTYSEERYDVYRADFLFPDLVGSQDQSSRRSELELDLHWKPRQALDALFGYRLLHIDQVRNRPDILPLVDTEDSLEPYTTHDLFAEVGWQVWERLRLVGGARLTRLPSSYVIERLDWLRGEAVRTVVQPESEIEINGRVAALWSPSADQVVKLIWGTASQDTAEASLAEPEQIQTFELNTTLTRPRWMLSASLFQNRIDNIARSIQVLDPRTGLYGSFSDDSGQWLTWGAELILEARPLPDLNLSASLTGQRTEDRGSGIDPGYSPSLLAKLKADWSLGPMTFSAHANYVDGMEADWNFLPGVRPGVVERIGERVPASWDLGLNLRWDPPGSGPYASLHVANLLDRENRYPANELTDLDLGLIGPGRAVALTLGSSF
jgi:outer membrane receptor protein involved in Fe transport